MNKFSINICVYSVEQNHLICVLKMQQNAPKGIQSFSPFYDYFAECEIGV